MPNRLRDIAAEAFIASDANSVEIDYMTDGITLRAYKRPDLHLSRGEIDDNLHHQILKEWSSGQKAST